MRRWSLAATLFLLTNGCEPALRTTKVVLRASNLGRATLVVSAPYDSARYEVVAGDTISWIENTDGRRASFLVLASGERSIWVRPLDELWLETRTFRPDSVLVTPSGRRWLLPEMHGGRSIELSVVPRIAQPQIPEALRLSIESLPSSDPGGVLEHAIESADAIVVGRLHHVESPVAKTPNISVLSILREDVWMSRGTVPGIVSVGSLGELRGRFWVPFPGPFGLRLGERSIYFLQRPGHLPAVGIVPPNAWRISLVAQFAEEESLTFSPVGRGLPTDVLRARISDLDPSLYSTNLIGSLRDAGGHPVDGVPIRIDGREVGRTESSGRFRARALSVGEHEMEVTIGDRPFRGRFESGERRLDSLVVTVPR